MNMQLRPWLLLTLSLLLPPRMATAQAPKQSHHDEPGGFDSASAEELMAQRLRELRELHQLQDQIQALLKDPSFRDSLNKRQISEADLQRLREKMPKVEGLSQNYNLKHLFQQAAGRQKLDQRQIENIFRRLANRAEHPRTPPAVPPMHSGPGPVALPPVANVPNSPTPPMSPPPAAESQPSLFDRMQKESTKWLMENLDDVGGDVMDAFAQMDERSRADRGNAGFLAEMLRSVRQADFVDMNLGDKSLFPTLRVGTLANSLSNVGDFLRPHGGVWGEMHSLFRDAPVPSFPRLGHSGAYASGSTTVSGGGVAALLSVLMLGAIFLLLGRWGLWKSPAGEDAGWRLGPWPLPPSSVSTRQDVIRVFEHLVLLCFGPAASVCHHRTLAERLAQQDQDNPGRRQAAEMLAWLYEQARYAPAADALSPEQISDARHALCLLAGVTAP